MLEGAIKAFQGLKVFFSNNTEIRKGQSKKI